MIRAALAISPFIVDFTAGIALRSGESVIMGISVAGTLSGPTPWHIAGSFSFDVLFWSVSESFSTTFGESARNIFAGAFIAAHAGEHDPP